jgi:hypothetical protein
MTTRKRSIESFLLRLITLLEAAPGTTGPPSISYLDGERIASEWVRLRRSDAQDLAAEARDFLPRPPAKILRLPDPVAYTRFDACTRDALRKRSAA